MGNRKSRQPEPEPLLNGSDVLDAVRYNDITKLKQSIEENYDYKKAVLPNGDTPLHAAVKWYKLKVVTFLLDNRVGPDIRGNNNDTLLHTAAAYGYSDIATSLIKAGAKIEAQNNQSWTPLHCACEKNRFSLVELLLTAGANIMAKTEKNKTPIELTSDKNIVKYMIPFKNKDGYIVQQLAVLDHNLDLIKYLLGQGIYLNDDSNHKGTMLNMAASGGYQNIVNYLLARGANPEGTEEPYKPTALHLAAGKGYSGIISSLIKKHAWVTSLTELDETALHWAAKNGQISSAKLLVENGSRLDMKNKAGKTPYELAWDGKHYQVEKYLRDATDTGNSTLLHWAAQRNDLKLVIFLVEHGCLINGPANTPNSPVHRACIYNNPVIVTYLLNKGADPNTKDQYDGSTPLHFEAESGNLDMVVLLVKHGALPYVKTQSGQTPIELAYYYKFTLVVDYLRNIMKKEQILSQIRKENNYKLLHIILGEEAYTLAQIVCDYNDVKIARQLLKNGAKVNEKNQLGQTPLHCAVNYKNKDMICELLQSKPSLNVKDEKGLLPIESAIENRVFEGCCDNVITSFFYAQDIVNNTCLHYAANDGNLELVTYLLKYGSYLNKQNDDGDTPLHLAVRHKHEEIVQLLLKNGTNVDLENKQGYTALDIATLQHDTASIGRIKETCSQRSDGSSRVAEINMIDYSQSTVVELIELFIVDPVNGPVTDESIPYIDTPRGFAEYFRVTLQQAATHGYIGKEYFPFFFLGSIATLPHTQLAEKLGIKAVLSKTIVENSTITGIKFCFLIESNGRSKLVFRTISTSEYSPSLEFSKYELNELVQLLRLPIDVSQVEGKIFMINLSKVSLSVKENSLNIADSFNIQSVSSNNFVEIKITRDTNLDISFKKLSSFDIEEVKTNAKFIFGTLVNTYDKYRFIHRSMKVTEAWSQGFVHGCFSLNFKYRYNLEIYVEPITGKGLAGLVFFSRKGSNGVKNWVAKPIVVKFKKGQESAEAAILPALNKGYHLLPLNVKTISYEGIMVGVNFDPEVKGINEEKLKLFKLHVDKIKIYEGKGFLRSLHLGEMKVVRAELERLSHTISEMGVKNGRARLAYMSRLVLGMLISDQEFPNKYYYPEWDANNVFSVIIQTANDEHLVLSLFHQYVGQVLNRDTREFPGLKQYYLYIEKEEFVVKEVTILDSKYSYGSARERIQNMNVSQFFSSEPREAVRELNHKLNDFRWMIREEIDFQAVIQGMFIDNKRYRTFTESSISMEDKIGLIVQNIIQLKQEVTDENILLIEFVNKKSEFNGTLAMKAAEEQLREHIKHLRSVTDSNVATGMVLALDFNPQAPDDDIRVLKEKPIEHLSPLLPDYDIKRFCESGNSSVNRCIFNMKKEVVNNDDLTTKDFIDNVLSVNSDVFVKYLTQITDHVERSKLIDAVSNVPNFEGKSEHPVRFLIRNRYLARVERVSEILKIDQDVLDALSDADLKGAILNIGFVVKSIGSASLAKWVEEKEHWGRLSAPFVSRVGSAYFLYYLCAQSKFDDKEDAIRNSLVLTSDASDTWEGLDLQSKISSVTGSILMALEDRWEQFILDLRDVKRVEIEPHNLANLVTTLEFLSHHSRNKDLVFSSAGKDKVAGEVVILKDMDIILDKEKFNLEWASNSPNKISHLSSLCLPTNNYPAASVNSSTQCKNAYDVLKQYSNGNFTYINVGDGNNYVAGSTGYNNYISVGNGYKNIQGGPLDDFILMNGTSYGSVDGGGGLDTLDLGHYAQTATTLHVDLQGKQISVERLTNTIKLNNINKVLGRQNKPDVVTCNTDIKYVDGRGGADVVIIPVEKPSWIDYKLQVVLHSGTTVKSTSKYGKIFLVVPRQQGAASVTLSDGMTPYVFLNYTADEIQEVSKLKKVVKLRLGTTDDRFNMTLETSKSNSWFKTNDHLTLATMGESIYGSQTTNKSVDESINYYHKLSNKLNVSMFVECMTENEFISIGVGELVTLSNNPNQISHLIAGEGDNIYRLIPVRTDSQPTSDVVLYGKDSRGRHSLDLKAIVDKSYRYSNVKLESEKLQNDIVLKLKNGNDNVLNMTLKGGEKWYKKVQVFLHEAPWEFVNETTLQPTPILFEKQHSVIIITPEDVEDNNVLVIPKTGNGLKYQQNKSNLIITNIHDTNTDVSTFFTVTLVKYFSVPKMKTLTIQFENKKISLNTIDVSDIESLDSRGCIASSLNRQRRSVTESLFTNQTPADLFDSIGSIGSDTNLIYNHKNGYNNKLTNFTNYLPNFNSTLLLLDVIARKLTGIRYKCTNINESICNLQQQGYAIDIVHEYENILNKFCSRFNVQLDDLDFDPFEIQKKFYNCSNQIACIQILSSYWKKIL